MSIHDQSHIDTLLERYLSLIDEYSQLREDLSRLQRGMFQDIARANFSAERGVRYGPDQYDDRMQISRKLDIQVDEGQVPTFTIATISEEAEEEDEQDKAEKDKSTTEEDKSNDEKGVKGKEDEKKKPKLIKDPIRWYGLFAPPALRSAQTNAVQAVQDVIPRLVTVNAEMLDVEIQVRRARKKRAKAEAADKKQQSTTEKTDSVEVEAS
jgi:hypothetical protein